MKNLSIILVVIIFVPISSLHAGIRLGVKGGVNLANASFNTDVLQTSNFTGIQVGPILEFSIGGIGLDAAVLYSQKGIDLRDFDLKNKKSTLDVPVNLKFKFGLVNVLGCYLTAGPYISFKLQGNDFSVLTDDIQNQFRSKSFGAGINLGGGVELLKHLQVGVNYQIGITDDYKSLNTGILNDIKAKTKIWSITTAYFF